MGSSTARVRSGPLIGVALGRGQNSTLTKISCCSVLFYPLPDQTPFFVDNVNNMVQLLDRFLSFYDCAFDPKLVTGLWQLFDDGVALGRGIRPPITRNKNASDPIAKETKINRVLLSLFFFSFTASMICSHCGADNDETP